MRAAAEGWPKCLSYLLSPDAVLASCTWWERFLQTRSGQRKKEPRPFQWQKAGPEALEDLPFRLRNCPLWNEVLPNGRPFLSWAVEYEDGEIVKLLLDLEADPDIRDTAEHQMTPLIKALKIGNMAMVDLLKRKDRYSMHILVDDADDMGEERALELTRKLLGQGYDLSKRNPKGQNPFHIACHKGRKQFVEEFLHPKYEKAFIHYADNSGKNALAVCNRQGGHCQASFGRRGRDQ